MILEFGKFKIKATLYAWGFCHHTAEGRRLAEKEQKESRLNLKTPE